MGNRGRRSPSGRSRRLVPGGRFHAARANQENIERCGDRHLPSRLDTKSEQFCREPRGAARAIGRARQAAGRGPRRWRREVGRAASPARQAAGPRADRTARSTATRRFSNSRRSPRPAPSTKSARRPSSGIGVISGVECYISGNDPTVRGGAVNPYTLRKSHAGLRYLRAESLAATSRSPSRAGPICRGSRKSFCPAARRFAT